MNNHAARTTWLHTLNISFMAEGDYLNKFPVSNVQSFGNIRL